MDEQGNRLDSNSGAKEECMEPRGGWGVSEHRQPPLGHDQRVTEAGAAPSAPPAPELSDASVTDAERNTQSEVNAEVMVERLMGEHANTLSVLCRNLKDLISIGNDRVASGKSKCRLGESDHLFLK